MQEEEDTGRDRDTRDTNRGEDSRGGRDTRDASRGEATIGGRYTREILEQEDYTRKEENFRKHKYIRMGDSRRRRDTKKKKKERKR